MLPDVNCAVLFALCAGSLCINLFTLRPDMDDISFFFRGLYYAEHLEEPISKYAVLFGMKDIPELSPLHHLSAMETSAAFIARIFNISGIVFVHQVVGGWALFFAPIVYYRLFRCLGFAVRPSLLGAGGAILYLILNGSSAAAAGNYSIVRAWQGKCFLIFIILPMLWTSLFTCLREKNSREIFTVYALTAIGIGLSSTAIFLLPFSAGLFTISVIIASGTLRNSFGTLWRISLSMLIIGFFVWFSRSNFFIPLNNIDVWTHSYPETLTWQFSFALPEFIPIALMLCLFAWVAAQAISTRTTLALTGYAVSVLVLPLLPGVSDLFMSILTPTVFWRLFCAFPGALLFGACWASLPGPSRKSLFRTAGIVGMTLFMWAANTPTLNANVLSRPHLMKFPEQDLSTAAFLQKHVEPGRQVAGPEAIMGVLGLLRQDLRYYCTRYNDTLHLFRNAKDPAMLEKRSPWIRYFYNPCSSDVIPKDFSELNVIDVFVVPQCAGDILQNTGIRQYFSHVIQNGEYMIFSKEALCK